MERRHVVSPADKNKDFLQALHAILLAANACRRMAPPGKSPSIAYAIALSFITNIQQLNKVKLKPEDQSANWQVATRDAEKLKELIVGGKEFTADELNQLEDLLIGLYGEISKITDPDKIPNDDELRNINSFEYLRNLAVLIPESLRNEEGFAEVWETCQPGRQYDFHIPYGNYYTQFLIALEEKIIKASSEKDLQPLDGLITAIYLNHNFALERAYLMNRKELGEVRQADYKKAEEKIREKFKQKTPPRKGGENIHSPVKVGSGIKLVAGNVLPDFKPMTTTSQPSMVYFAYKTSTEPQQLRFGTQGQIIDYHIHVNPIFKRWLQIQNRLSKGRSEKITHIYFNNLSRTGGEEVAIDIKRKSREDSLTQQLEALENQHPNIAVLTMPSDGGMMSHHAIKQRRRLIPGEVIFQKLLAIANGTSTEPYGKELYISPRMRDKLFASKEEENKTLKELLNNSFAALGFTRDQMLSRSDQQAVYFHFVKFELANGIIDKIQPATFNFSCKDAIDRGGVSSAYYNLMKSIEKGQPLSQNEFECILHGAPILVKGRPMNDHIKLIWNTIDAYINAHHDDKKMPSWLPKWRDNHAPKEDMLYSRVLEKGIEELEQYIAEKEKIKDITPAIKPKFTPQFKHALAIALLDALKEHQKNHKNIRALPCQLMTEKEKYAGLHDGELYKRIVKPLEKNGLLVLDKKVIELSPDADQQDSYHVNENTVRQFEKIVKDLLASRKNIESVDTALMTCEHLIDCLEEFDSKLLQHDPSHPPLMATQLDKLTDIQATLEQAQKDYQNKTYSPSTILSFAHRSQVVTPEPGQSLDDAIAEVLAQGAPAAQHLGNLSDTASTNTTDDFVHDKARVNFSDVTTGIGPFTKTTTVKSVQLMRDTVYKLESHFDPAQLSRFGTKGFRQWAMSEIDDFRHANPLDEKHVLIEGDYPEKYVRYAIAYCILLKLPYTNLVNDKFKPTNHDFEEVRKEMAKPSRASVDSRLRETDLDLRKTPAGVKANIK